MDEKKELKKIKDGLTDLEKKFEQSTNKLNKALAKHMTPEEYGRFKAFLTKYLKLMEEGKIVEAKELEKTYRGE